MIEHVKANIPEGETYTMTRFHVTRGADIGPGETSATGLYGITSRRKDKLLRVSLCRETANVLCDFDCRFLQTIYLNPAPPRGGN